MMMTMRMTQILMVFPSQACFRLDSTSEDGRELLVPSGEKTNYFEKVFLNLLPFTTDYLDHRPILLLSTLTTDQFSYWLL